MKDLRYIVIFIAVGLGLAFLFSGPLRNDVPRNVNLGTEMNDRNVYVQGTVKLAKSLAGQPDKTPFLFVFVKPASQPMGAPLAVKKYTRVNFPFTFTLTQEDHVVPGMDFQDVDINVTARLDADGMAGPEGPDDLSISKEVSAGGSRKIELLFQ